MVAFIWLFSRLTQLLHYISQFMVAKILHVYITRVHFSL